MQLEGGTFREKTLALQKFSECQMVAGCPVSQFVRLDYIFISICAFQIVVTSVIICYSLSCFVIVSVEKKIPPTELSKENGILPQATSEYF